MEEPTVTVVKRRCTKMAQHIRGACVSALVDERNVVRALVDELGSRDIRHRQVLEIPAAPQVVEVEPEPDRAPRSI
jgi:hypothetical protein